MRQRTAWKIYQNIEYAGEQNQVKLYNFFLDLMQATISKDPRDTLLVARALQRTASVAAEDEELEAFTSPHMVSIDLSSKGPHILLPLDKSQFETLIDSFQKGEILHAHYVLLILHEVRKLLKQLPNINIVSTSRANVVTVVGDLHGNLSDLMVIFHKNGIPSNDNPYIYNGDIVDRGSYSIEVFILICVSLLLYPNGVFINRGNHEDHVMNLRYGFMKEVISKYKSQATRILRLFENVFSWLPLASVIDEKIFVTHGGISDITDLNIIKKIKRHKYVSVLSPSFIVPYEDEYHIDGISKEILLEWRQVLDILWSDPHAKNGCEPNLYRGGGCYFGQDITEMIMKKHKWSLIIRSHECKREGFDYCHNDKVLTIFSASNYYSSGSNKGAYVKIIPNIPPIIIQFMVTKTRMKPMTMWERVSRVEEHALRNLIEKFHANEGLLMKKFLQHDPNGTGKISLNEWCDIVTNVLSLRLPWRTLRSRLVEEDDTKIIYESTFKSYELQCLLNVTKPQSSPTVCQTIYRNKELLETVFRAIDKDNSGFISLEEFKDVCTFLGRHKGSLFNDKQIIDLATSIDLDKNGIIDFNEFLEAFRIVDINSSTNRLNMIATPLDPL
ncbi:unnamed protein product [Didymodactylos carnosus]|uniref:Serine/threonine-protein phosphatase n=1 Tax=Didymodactylos carnosus TaxID=1234261 RepID=A0A813SH61_9BILA|nr:unnamed protein product [Didymodactylos carnosus]CAF0800521.1 unnamed protein product [Didymodactylos carnosus]CAF3495960.1 unnamed protein product [Didymodactylos carnosus]CAF3585516.1 unnamed protein product [Didymodactylos carnosus]